jgi:hypothetical protein
MHEVLAPLLWLFHTQTAFVSSLPAGVRPDKPAADDDEEMIRSLMSPDSIEADCFYVFEILMHHLGALVNE